MILTTTHTIEGETIKKYMGIVSGALIYGLTGGNKMANAGWQRGISDLNVLLMDAAEERGADAVIGISYFPVGVYICATGTAVELA